MIYALATGALFRDPETKTSKAGKSYVAATLISKDGAASTFVNVVVFSDSAKDEILALGAGDSVSAQGKATIGVYEKNGEHRPSLSIIADRVLALRQPREAVKSRDRKPPQRGAPYRGGAAAFDDGIPFGEPP